MMDNDPSWFALELPTADTRLIALLGDPVGHSLSPVIQNAAFQAAEVDGVYLALQCATSELPGLLKGLARAGGGGNVTLPHKAQAAGLLEHRTDAVLRTGACNTFWLEDGRICGDNTDVQGFSAASLCVAGDLAGARVLLLGAGGAARAALVSLLDAKVDSVAILNRTVETAASLSQEFHTDRVSVNALAGMDSLPGERYDLVVNATSLGLGRDDPLPLDLRLPRSVGVVLDMVYSPGETPWVRHARRLGIKASDGLEMLIQQAASAFRHWWRSEPSLKAMRDVVRLLGNHTGADSR